MFRHRSRRRNWRIPHSCVLGDWLKCRFLPKFGHAFSAVSLICAERTRGDLVRPLLVIVTVIRSHETRSLVKTVVECAGHAVIESGGYMQAALLLSNGLVPDLILVDSTPTGPVEVGQLSKLLKSAPPSS